MMGRSHALCGVLAGCGLVALVPSAPLPVRGLLVAVTGGAALLPDLDHPSSTAARSIGLLTKLIAHGLSALSLAVYHATRETGDPGDRHSGHRLLTHTLPGSLLAGLLVAAACLLHPAAAAVSLGLLAGLLSLGLHVAGIGLAVGAAGVAWWASTTHPGWWWLYGVAVTVGCLAHIAGDACTNSGVPLAWPLLLGGRRWRLLKTPVTFATGTAVETALVTPVLLVAVAVAGSWVTGVLALVVSAVTAS